jgi:hypothetical protein
MNRKAIVEYAINFIITVECELKSHHVQKRRFRKSCFLVGICLMGEAHGFCVSSRVCFCLLCEPHTRAQGAVCETRQAMSSFVLCRTRRVFDTVNPKDGRASLIMYNIYINGCYLNKLKHLNSKENNLNSFPQSNGFGSLSSGCLPFRYSWSFNQEWTVQIQAQLNYKICIFLSHLILM